MALKSFGGFVDKNSQNPAKYLARTKKDTTLGNTAPRGADNNKGLQH